MNKTIFIRLFGLCFILIAIHRCIFKNDREKELKFFKMPKYFDIFIILFELIIGLLLLFNVSYRINVLFFLLIFIIIGSVVIFYYNHKIILSSYNTICTFQPTMMCFIMHLYIAFIIIMLICL